MSANEQGADATGGRWLTLPRTLCFITNGNDVLLMKRASHRRVFPNRYNGVGGHVERDEDPLTSARREIYEETGLMVRDLQLCAIHNIDAGHNTGIVLFVFRGESDSREVRGNDEGVLYWVPVDEVGALDLVDDLPDVLPRVLAMQPGDAPYFVHVSYNDNDRIQLRFADG